MGVLLNGDGSASGVEFHPGPLTDLGKKSFRTAYEAMAARAGLWPGF